MKVKVSIFTHIHIIFVEKLLGLKEKASCFPPCKRSHLILHVVMKKD